MAACNVHASVCNGRSAELHEMEGAQQKAVTLLDLSSVAHDGGRERQMENRLSNLGFSIWSFGHPTGFFNGVII